MNDVPRYEIVAIYGEVFGLIVRARNVFSNFGATCARCSAASRGYTKLLSESRSHATRAPRLAHREGGNAVIAMRFDCNEIANLMSESPPTHR